MSLDNLDTILAENAKLHNELEIQRIINAAAGRELVKMYQSAALAYATLFVLAQRNGGILRLSMADIDAVNLAGECYTLAVEIKHGEYVLRVVPMSARST